MDNYTKPSWRYRFWTAFGRRFYAFRLRLEEWQDWIDGMAGRYDPDQD